MKAVRTVFFILLAVGVFIATQVGKRWITTHPYFGVAILEITGNHSVTPGKLQELTRISGGENIFTLDLKAVRQRILNYPWVKEATIKRKPPRTLKIDLVERKALAVMESKPEALLDEEGVVLQINGDVVGQKFPRISGDSWDGVKPGQYITGERTLKALEMIKVISLIPFLPEGELLRVDVERPGYETIYLRGEEAPIIIGTASINDKLKRFSAIRERLHDKQGGIQYINLTFKDKVVVKYSK